MKYLFSSFLILLTTTLIAQVGIGTVNPNATIDIVASNQATPTNNDGILIPRIDVFPATNPTLAQDSMIVYLTTTDGTDAPGFYYWNNATTSWLPFGGASTTGWDLTGNAGTVNGTNFLGTTDNQNLDIRTNNIVRARFTSQGQLEFLNNGSSVFIGEGAGAADDLTTNRNVFIGYEAGNDVTSGFNNIALGLGSFDRATTGSRNIAIGVGSLDADLDPESTVAIGSGTLGGASGNVTNTVAIGASALSNSTDAVDNLALGYRAGANVDGPDNVFLGANADWLNANSGATQNVIIGSGAGQAGSGGGIAYNGRILIGYQAGRDNGINNSLFIENSSSVTPLLYGEFDNNILRIGGQLQIGSSDDTTAGVVYGFPTVDGTSGQALVTDGLGNVTWQTIAGGGLDTQDLSINNVTADLSLVDGGTVEIKTIADSDDDTKIQTEEGIDDDTIRFDIAGTEHFTMLTNGKLEVLNTGNSIYIGDNAGQADLNTADKENVMIGTNAGQNITTSATSAFHGRYNVGIGFNALQDQTRGHRNTAVGHGAAESLTTGTFNTAIGHDALKNATFVEYNTIMGNDAAENINGNGNTAIGYRALMGFSGGTGANNTAMGDGVGSRIRNGSNNVWIGQDTEEFNENGNNNTIIGTDAGASIGSSRSLSGRVLIGYNAGRSTGGVDNTLYIENSNSTAPLIGGDFANDRLAVNVDMSILGTGNYTRALNVEGSVFASGDFITTTATYPDYVFDNYFNNFSSINKTYSFTPLDKAIEFVKDNGHLPNVKSYEEIKSNNMNIDLGSTSVKNLEKIEENFIYIMELKEELDELKNENIQLREKLEQLVKYIESK